ncbi:MAG TPA: diguanylate cyclase [Longimicrobiaceae bacterium]|nr:diguanylate cyclase [Longimicrobiaceae bacterium]
MIRRTEHLEILNEIARIATLDLELRPMLQRITDALLRKFGWEFVACVSLDRARGRFVCEALSSTLPSQVYVGYNREIGSGVVGEVALTGRPLLLDDVRDHPNFVETQLGTLSELCVPVRHRGEVVALLNLESPRLGAFHDQLPLLETVAEQIGGAIASARLHQELTYRARLLEMVSEVSKAAMDAGELQLLLDRVVGYIHERFPLLVVSILLADMDAGTFAETAVAGSVPRPSAQGKVWSVQQGIVGRALRSGQPQLVPDVRADPDYLEVNDSTVAEFVVPILYRGRPLGVLNLESDAPDIFTQESEVAFRTFADQLAGAIHMASINQALEEANDRLREANQRLERLSSLDGLTEVANRRHFDEALAVEWRRAARSGQALSLIMIDIDCFKDYNDTYGHRRGDQCLREVAGVLKGAVQRAGEVVARYGGEEFAVLLPGTPEEGAGIFAELLRRRVEDLHIPHQASSAGTAVTVSLGVATVAPSPRLTPNDLVDAADRALYQAKHEGRNRVASAPAPGHGNSAGALLV